MSAYLVFIANRRLSNRCLEHRPPPIELTPLLELGHRVEALFGQPQDIEWAYAKGQFYLLQARKFTASVQDRKDRLELLELFGHRAPNDYELAQPRYSEDEAQLDALIERAEYPECAETAETPGGRYRRGDVHTA